ncbi:P-II family nitrogen regulator [Rhodothermus profundi]|uniref:Nitrogen regulatory protein P-II family n=1 Tax=Rhodothermus profundi TaxID=633813 RepID=A0A1M6RIX2_9BACT|nr:transcriptional regulator [Rhodothermus profundi]SHK32318.1 nitrogen regulatory protein P-II family [Rhodothermus profundi]
MPTVTLKLVTIVAERVLQERLLRTLKELGARGYTLTDVSGEGSRGVRASEWEGHNVKIETIVSPEVAERIIEHVAEHYFQHYAVIVYAQPVEVVRGDKYV